LQVKKMQMTSTDVPNLLHYASTKLLSIAPNVETLFLYSLYEVSVIFLVPVQSFVDLSYK
jgi:hypothetical protein